MSKQIKVDYRTCPPYKDSETAINILANGKTADVWSNNRATLKKLLAKGYTPIKDYGEGGYSFLVRWSGTSILQAEKTSKGKLSPERIEAMQSGKRNNNK